jgi:putative endopeptidase
MQGKDAGKNSSASAGARAWRSHRLFAKASVRFVCRPTRAAIFAFALCACVGAGTSAQNISSKDMDTSVKPGEDFYRYANGGWLGRVAKSDGKTILDMRTEVKEKSNKRVQELVEEAAREQTRRGSISQKVGDYYASFADRPGIEAKGLTPLAEELTKIAAIADRASLSAYLGTTLNGEVDGLVSNSDHIFGLWINQGFEDAEHNVVHVWQGGLGMPERDDYLDASSKSVELREKYRAHIAATLKLLGTAESETRAGHILSLEIRIAQAFAPDSEAADTFKQNNPWKRAEFGVKAPGMDWEAYFKSAGLLGQQDFMVWQPSAVTGVSALIANESTEVWKDYLKFHLIEHYSSVLPEAVAAEDFAFYGTVLTNAQQMPDRKTQAIAATNGALGQAVGQLYMQRYFPPGAKKNAQAMVGDLIAAYRGRISKLTWMCVATKEKALAKLAALEVIVGYPDKWIDYAALDVVRGDAFGNLRRAEAFLRTRNLTKLKEAVDPIEWPVNPQVAAAVIMFSPNAEFFTAGILQAPYFDSEGDNATNYGSAGAAMAHEITHSFDELGNIYDAHGRLGAWWTDKDRNEYRKAAEKLAGQFDGYCPFADLCVNGKQTLSENGADLAGLLVAHDAYVLSLKGKSDAVIGGLTGEQRFFVAFAQRWRRIPGEATLRQQIKSDTHAPGEYRSETVRNVDAWYKAFGVAPGDKLFVKPEDRARIW